MLNGHGTAVQGAVVDAPALHPLHCIAQLFQFCLFLLILLHLQVESSLLFIHVEGVVAGIKFRMAVHNFNHPLGNLVNKVAVMGNGKHRALKGLDVVFQPFHAVKIQVVGGFVQQQNVCLFQQKPSKVHSGFFSAGEAGKLLTALLLGNAQTIADFVHLHIHLIAAASLKAAAQPIIFPQLALRCPRLHHIFQLAHFLLHLLQFPIGRAQYILHIVALRENGNLGNQPQAFIGIDIDLALIIINFLCQNAKQRGLTAAVAPQNGDPLALLDFKRESLQQVLSDNKKLCQIIYGYINHSFSPTL